MSREELIACLLKTYLGVYVWSDVRRIIYWELVGVPYLDRACYFYGISYHDCISIFVIIYSSWESGLGNLVLLNSFWFICAVP
ncbi:hypothetical protein VNO77_15263 [Canavalia gladiata]|uniref:Uncharacterized protein n=1 Tax=Canavalia gladiata TaxID=3824 RepID=A0AAN9QSA2_CANGL